MLTVHARKHPDGSVTIYRDAALSDKFCTFDKWHSSKPDYRNKYIMLNCYKWRINWG